MKSTVFAIVASFLLSGCISIGLADAGEPSVQRNYLGLSKAEVWQSVMTRLAEQDIPVVASDFERGKIRARQHNYLNAAWASCVPGYHRSFDPTHVTNLRARSWPLYRGVDLRVEIIETDQGTTLSLKPRFSNVDRDSQRREFAFQIPCQSTGVLEQALFSAPREAS